MAPPDGRAPGVQPERTRLAWQRTTVSAAGVCAVAAMTAVRIGFPVLVVPASALALAALVAVVHHPRNVARTTGRDVWSSLLLTVGVVVTVALVGLAMAAHRFAQSMHGA